MTKKALHVSIAGRVQGVSYRAWARDEAAALGLTGWIRNRHDGSVEALVCGRAEAVDQLVERFWAGPPAANVKDVLTRTADIAPKEEGFAIAATV